MDTISPLLALLLSLLCLVLLAFEGLRRRKSFPYPPGPRRYPIIGSAQDIPSKAPWLTYSSWADVYGPLTYLSAFGQPILIINSHEVADDLLDKRGHIYSERPKSTMAGELVGFDFSTVLQSYTHKLRKIRQLYNKALSPRVVQQDYRPLQEAATYDLLNRLLERPDSFLDHIRDSQSALFFKIVYGATSYGGNDFIKLAHEHAVIFSKVITGYLVDYMPILKHIPAWFPGAKFKRDAAVWKSETQRGRDLPFQLVKGLKAVGPTDPSFCSILLDTNEDEAGGPEGELMIKNSAATLIRAGTDTTMALLQAFLLAMVLNPDVQARAQEEIDRVVGRDRLPTWEDKDSMPYTSALLLESLRYHPSAPLGVPHVSKQDDIYNGFFIPAGTIIRANLWHIAHDPKLYPNPEKFMPERFLGLVQSGTKSNSDSSEKDSTPTSGDVKGSSPRGPNSLDPRQYVFGYGRRLCPGVHVAQASAWIMMVSMLATFNIKKKKDAQGKEITPVPNFSTALVSFPEKFVCDITPRSETASILIKEGTAAA